MWRVPNTGVLSGPKNSSKPKPGWYCLNHAQVRVHELYSLPPVTVSNTRSSQRPWTQRVSSPDIGHFTIRPSIRLCLDEIVFQEGILIREFLYESDTKVKTTVIVRPSRSFTSEAQSRIFYLLPVYSRTIQFGFTLNYTITEVWLYVINRISDANI